MNCMTCGETKRGSLLNDTEAGPVCNDCMEEFLEKVGLEELSELDEETMEKAFNFSKKRHEDGS